VRDDADARLTGVQRPPILGVGWLNCLSFEMGCDPVDIGKTIHPHPTLSESIGMAAELFEGVCTDLPPVRKK
jgi:hypothetical protein